MDIRLQKQIRMLLFPSSLFHFPVLSQEPAEAPTMEHLLGPVSTRNLLISFLWVLKNVDNELLQSWWSQLSISRYRGTHTTHTHFKSTSIDGMVCMCTYNCIAFTFIIHFRFNILMDVMDLSVACFEYRVRLQCCVCVCIHVLWWSVCTMYM